MPITARNNADRQRAAMRTGRLPLSGRKDGDFDNKEYEGEPNESFPELGRRGKHSMGHHDGRLPQLHRGDQLSAGLLREDSS